MRLSFKIAALLLSLLTAGGVFAQQDETPKPRKRNYFQAELSFPFKQNEAYNDNEDETFFRLAGAYFRAGFGRRLTDYLSAGLHSGIEWKSDPGFVSAPVFGNLKLAPRITRYDELRPFASFGYGKVFVLNKGNISGNFLRGNLGVDVPVLDDSGKVQKGALSIFMEISYYQFKPRDYDNLSTFNLGIGYTFF